MNDSHGQKTAHCRKAIEHAHIDSEDGNSIGESAALKMTLLRLYNPPKSELVPDPEELRSVKASDNPRLARGLSPRLLEMIHLMDKRLTNAQIAAEMKIKPTTARGFRQRLFHTLSVDSAEDAVKEARKRGFFQLPLVSVHSCADDGGCSGDWPETVSMLYHPRTGTFSHAIISSGGREVHGPACFESEEIATLFGRQSQYPSENLVVELCLKDAREIVLRQDDPKIGSLVLLSESHEPRIQRVRDAKMTESGGEDGR